TPTLRGIAPAGRWGSINFQRWGWSHGTKACGGLRIGFTSDGDTVDNLDAAIGVGFHLGSASCNPAVHAAVDYGSGFYHFPWPQLQTPSPTAAPLPARVWLR